MRRYERIHPTDDKDLLVSHPTDDELRLFATGELGPEQYRGILFHLLARCPECGPKLAWLLPVLDGREPPPRPDDPAFEPIFEPIFERLLATAPSHEARIAREREARESFLALFGHLHLSAEEVLERLDEGMPVRACVDVLLTLSFAERARNPGKMLSLAMAARILALNLPHSEEADSYFPAEISDLQARVWGELANAYRVVENHPEAEQSLVQAATARAIGTGDPMVLARLLDVEASLRTDQRRFYDADHLLRLVEDLYRQVGEIHLAGRALISRGISLHYDGDPSAAVAMLRKALTLLDGPRDPILLATGRQALLDAMVANGEFVEAAEILLYSGLREAFEGEPLHLLKVRWLEGRIYAGRGKLQLAENAFAEARRGFLGYGLEYEAALVGLDAAGVLLTEGRLDEVEALGSAALETFQFLDIGREAVKAVRYLHEAFVTRQATTALVREVVKFLERFERRPDLRFQAPMS